MPSSSHLTVALVAQCLRKEDVRNEALMNPLLAPDECLIPLVTTASSGGCPTGTLTEGNGQT